MALISLNEVSLSFGGPLLLDKASFQVEAGERLGLLGRNGSGKSSLLRLIIGEHKPDSGVVDIIRGTRIGYLPQEVPTDLNGKVRDIVLDGLGETGAKLKQHDALLAKGIHDETYEELHHWLENADAWNSALVADQLITRMALPPEAEFSSLSAGMKRRVLLARELVAQPDLLILDEPTNHLDITAIDWLEDFLSTQRAALLFVTHDRRFLQKMATSILDLDRGNITRWDCDYEKFLERKEAWLEAEASTNAEFDKKLAREEAWLRQGVKARRCRNEGRVRALQQLRRERRSRREQAGQIRAAIAEADRSGTKVIDVINVGHAWNGDPLIRDLTMTIMRGDRIGLLGPNGTGKTTLLKILLGQITPTQGRVQHGTNLNIAYFDQLREQLNLEKTVAQNLADDTDHVTVGRARKHVISYLGDFLFEPDRARAPVSMLSGGERNRLLLAKLFLNPANVLVLDEPTNDHEVETLEWLEELVSNFDGTVLLVSHDRAFLDNVTTSYLVFEGNGVVREFVGDYDTWRKERVATASTLSNSARDNSTTDNSAEKPRTGRTRKLSNKENRELEELPARIEALETEQADITTKLADPEFYRDPTAVQVVQARLPVLEAELLAAYERWSELDAIVSAK
ncbi:MAG: ATP-binding cassette domain-containing protein [Puniceicoccales bacterium]|jgi:ATP-binding cassette subfamily F protein uup|nr:ATP-binding cassette domain-containing protein [Puniceicoccales bacterium]